MGRGGRNAQQVIHSHASSQHQPAGGKGLGQCSTGAEEIFDYGDDDPEPHITWFAAFTTYLGYAVLIFLGRIRDIIGPWVGELQAPAKAPNGMAPLIFPSENFYTRRLYYRVQEAFNRPILGPPGGNIQVVTRERRPGDMLMHVKKRAVVEDVVTEAGGGRVGGSAAGGSKSGVGGEEAEVAQSGKNSQREEETTMLETTRCLNLGSYNYLGFADDWQSTCGSDVKEVLGAWPVGLASSRMDLGTTRLHKALEAQVASFLGKEDAIVYNMGFATNSTTIPALCGKGDLIISDALNHTSIVNGARASQALIRIFKHNDAEDLEKALRNAISMGQPRTRRPWNKIIVAVEGIYSMEGEICNLKPIQEVCSKYKVYLYLDEAHSIGALGATGRGVTEHCGVDTKDVAVMMGTFTKSFGGMGGYIAADKKTIDHLRVVCAGSVHHNAMSPVVCQQIITALRIIDGKQGGELGRKKLEDLRSHANYFRRECKKMGLHVYGDYDSPVVPVLLYNPTKILAFSRECFKRGLAVVVVGFPATPVVLSRCRFCISAGHTRAQLEDAVEKLKEVTELLKLRYANSPFG